MKESNYVSVAIILAVALVIILVRYILPRIVSVSVGLFPIFVGVLFCIALLMLVSELFGKR